MKSSHNLSGIAFDFFALVILFSSVLFSLFFAKHLLFHENQHRREITFVTESIPLEFTEKIDVGDTLYDTLKKRKLGEIKNIERIYVSERVKFIVTADAAFTPSSDALRTRSLWFRIKLTEEM